MKAIQACAMVLAAAVGWAGTLKVVLEDYESPSGLRLTGGMVQPGSKVRLSEKEPFEGKRCVEVHYRFADVPGIQYVEANTRHRLPGAVRRIAVAVRGDGSGQFVRVRLSDRSGECHQFDLGKVDFTGWRVLSTEVAGPHGSWGGDGNGKLDPPLTFLNFVLDALVRPGQGVVAFDAATIEADGKPEDFMETRFEPTRPHGYFWGEGDVPGGTLTVTGGTAEPASGTVEVRLLDHRERPLAEVWKGKVSVQHGKPVTRKLGLRPERYGVYFVEARVGDAVQRHSLCWLPEPARPWPDGPFGVCCHFGQHKHTIPLTFELMEKMGVAWFRDEISWGGSERKKGAIAFQDYHQRYMATAGERGLRPFIIFDYGNSLYDEGNAPTSPEAVAAFCRYCQELMKRFRSVCQHWEVWNEPNIFFWKPKPNVADYTKLLKAVYPAAKEVNPKATIVGVCTAGTDLRFVEGVLARGGAKFMDAISVHPYRYPRSPEASDFLGEMARLKALLDKHSAGHLKVWLTEFGYPTQKDPRGVSEARSAAYLAQTCLHALSLPYVERLFIYDFQNDGTDPTYNEANFGLIRLDNTPKVAYAAHSTMARMMHEKRFARAVDAGDGIVCYEFAGKGGKVLAAWAKGTAATLALRTAGRELTVVDLMGNATAVAPVDGRITMPLSEEPLFLTGHGDVAKAEPLIQVAGEAIGCCLEPIVLKVTPAPALAGRAWRAHAPEGWSSRVGEGGTLTLTAPRNAPDGDHPVLIEAGTVRVVAAVTLRQPIALQTRPAGPNQVRATLVNPFARERKLVVRGKAGTSAVTKEVALGPKAMATVDVPAPGERPDGWATVRAEVEVSLGDRWSVKQHCPGGTTPCYRLERAAVDADPAKWAGRKPCLLGARDQAVALKGHAWGGKKDLSARFWTGWTDEHFVLALAVTDNQHTQAASAGAEMWKGDSVQFAIAPRTRRHEFGVALGPDGKALTWQWAPASRAPKGVAAAARREGGVTHYEVAIPWKLIGATPRPGAVLRFALLVNDNDGKGRKGWLEWFSGIGASKDPTAYGPLELLPRQGGQ